MQHLKIFQVEDLGTTIVVTPQGEGSSFRYQDMHLESNVIRGRLAQPQVENLVICLSEMDYFGSEFIGALVSMLREMRVRKRNACICGAKPQTLQVLQNMSLFKLWPYYETREQALSQSSAVAN